MNKENKLSSLQILVACEESQTVTKELRKLGHEAYSCDIIECSCDHNEWHIMQDVLPLLNGNCEFKTVDGVLHKVDGKWDAIIAFPPCTYLTVSGNRWFNEEKYGEKAVRKNLTIPAWLNTFAEANHINFSQVLQESLTAIYQKQQA